MNILAYLVADLHQPETLGPTWRHLPGVQGDALFAIKQIAELAARQSAFVVAAGDNWDGPDPTPDALTAAYAAWRPLDAIPLYYILGNHDRGRDWFAPSGRNAIRLSAQPLTEPWTGLTLSGLDWTDPQRFPSLAAQQPPTDLGAYHQAFDAWMVGGRSAVSLSDLPAHKIAVCGDIHVRATVRPAKGPQQALSPGPATPQAVTEFSLAPQIYGLTDQFEPVTVPLQGRRFLAADVDSIDSANAAIEMLTSLAPDPALPDAVACPVFTARSAAFPEGFIAAAQTIAAARQVHFTARLIVPATALQRERAPVFAAASLSDAVSRQSFRSARERDLALALIRPNQDPLQVLAAEREKFERESDDHAFTVD